MAEKDNIVSIVDKRQKHIELEKILTGAPQDEIDLDSLLEDDEKVAKMNIDHAYIRNFANGRPRVLTYQYNHTYGKVLPEFITPEALMLQYSNETAIVGNKPIEIGKYWIRHPLRRTYDALFFDPDLPEVHKNSFNLWVGLAVEPKKGCWKKSRKHLYKILCNRDTAKFKYVYKWLAWMVQNPGSPAETAIVFKGKQGAGKGFIFSQFLKIYGKHGFTISNSDHLTGKFNSHLSEKVFLFSDENINAGDKKSEGVLKQLITEKYIPTEGKFLDAKLVKNCLHICMASNEDWVVPATDDSRRFFINKVDERYAEGVAPEEVKKPYFTALWSEMENGGREAMLYDLMHTNLKNWHPRQAMPATDELLQQQLLSMGRKAKAVYYLLEEGVLPEYNLQDVEDGNEYLIKYKSLRAYLDDMYPEGKSISQGTLRDLLTRIGVPQIHTDKGNFLRFPELHIVRENFRKHVLQKLQWNAQKKWRKGATEF